MDQLDLFAAASPPRPLPRDPAVWIARLLLLRAPALADDAIVRDMAFRRGLNILWAPPTPLAGGNRLREGRLSGHTAGKTTFCRILRYLLGEERFGTARTQERIRARFPEGWAVGEIVVRGDRWIVGRPFALGLHPFAVRGASVAQALAQRGPYQDFLTALTDATTATLPVRALPHARRPLDWPQLLTWIARDQEARFAGIVELRHPGSESSSPSPTIADRHVVLRATLDLMSDEERTLQQEQEDLADRRKRIESEGALLRRRADEDRRRLVSLLAMAPDEGEAGPLFATRLRERVASHRAALEGEAITLAPEEAAAAEILDAATRAAGELALRDHQRREAEAALAQHRARLSAPEPRTSPSTEAAPAAPLALQPHPPPSVSLALQPHPPPDAPLAAPPGPRAAGRCNVPLTTALARGCPHAATEAETHAAHAALPLFAATFARPSSTLSLAPSDHHATDAGRTDSHPRQLPADHLADHLADLEARAAASHQAWLDADAAGRALHDAYLQKNAAVQSLRARLAEGRAALAEAERLHGYASASLDLVQDHEQALARVTRATEALSKRKSQQQRQHGEALACFSARFHDVVQALLGRDVIGRADVRAGELGLHISEHGERDGAAMETVKVLAFDLAALSLGAEGSGHFPGLLIHDGPREADLDSLIYERLFLYAEELEARSPGEPSFQYLVTTTAPPPERLQRAPWLLEPRLDASTPEGRLLGLDL
ncbi:hypothetical protein [Chondromyces apiculatus]|uniref:Putative chromosome segregation SMC protein n=1 Tax=Chondromyces apiculatus DSM 436 TaxID=1192034 RepID=A0A017T0T7_9BACT|nr:hypothetical protein [Chondromyces apiculatus]EYF02843.1 Putative chromosome segregation SMC protein [Chondromyces apiculatus DSM 436]